MRDLIQHGHVRRPLLGISIFDVTPEDAEVYRLKRIEGVVVEDFADASPAERSGLRRHDVIVAVDGTPIERVGQLQRLVALHDPGETVRLTVVRYGDSLEVSIRLMEAERSETPAAASTPPSGPAGLGLELEELTQLRARQLGYERAGGAVIARVIPGGAADRKDMGGYEHHRIIAIDDRDISSVGEARAALRAARSGQILSLLVENPHGRTYIFNIRVP
jgi:S1-C subfamily serine protease